jgi:hypothetical protein
MRTVLCLLFFLSLANFSFGQKILQIETYGRAKTEKLFIGQGITYQLKDSKDWHYVIIEDLLIEQQLIQTVRGYLKLSDIGALRNERGWAQAAKVSLITFGAGWSLFGIIGYATDGNPETKYSAGDAIFLLPPLPPGFSSEKYSNTKKQRLEKGKTCA